MNTLPLITGHGLDGILAWLPTGPRNLLTTTSSA